MARLIQTISENKKLKRKLKQYEEVYGCCPHIDDGTIKGGYRVVKNVQERDAIPCCYRKKGMVVMVIDDVEPFSEYILNSDNCKNNDWVPIVPSIAEINWGEILGDINNQIDLKNILDQKADKTDVPTLLSELIDDVGYLTTETDPTVPSWAKQPNKPNYDYSEISNTPFIPEDISDLTDSTNLLFSRDYNDLINIPNSFPPSAHTHPWNQVTGKPDFHIVATSGNYNDLDNIPTSFPPSAHTHTWYQITDKPNFHVVATSGDYHDLNNKPVNVSEFTNDSGFITEVKTDDTADIELKGDGTIANPLEAGIKNKIPYKTIDTSVTEPDLAQLNAHGTDRVDFPNLDRIYFLNGAKWTYVETNDI